jgi:hypothetical protein
MFLFKFLSLNNIITYGIYAIFIIIILFLIYKYLYLEQAVYLINNKLDRIESEIENSNSNSCSYSNNSPMESSNSTSSNMMKSAEIIMNEIFNIEASPMCCPTPHQRREEKINKIEPVDEIVPVIEEPIVKNNIFDLKRKTSLESEREREGGEKEKEREEINDKESTVSNIIGGGHAVKKSLMKLTIDKLKEKCEERNLSTEGTKNQLADRIIIFDNENSQE